MSSKPEPGPALPPPPLQRDGDELMRIAKGFEMRLRRPDVEQLKARVG